jgi:hypothetical protein
MLKLKYTKLKPSSLTNSTFDCKKSHFLSRKKCLRQSLYPPTLNRLSITFKYLSYRHVNVALSFVRTLGNDFQF